MAKKPWILKANLPRPTAAANARLLAAFLADQENAGAAAGELTARRTPSKRVDPLATSRRAGELNCFVGQPVMGGSRFWPAV